MKKIFIAEFVGTFFVIFLGCGSLILQSSYASFVFGITVAVFITLLGKYSGAHFNPAVSLGFFVFKKISFKNMLVYWSGELTGAIAASAAHALLFSYPHSFGENIPQVSSYWAFAFEVIGTFILVGVILTTISIKRISSIWHGPIIGSAVFLLSQFIGPFSGGSFNPARTLAPALFTQNFSWIWLYFPATLLGAFFGSLAVTKAFDRFHRQC